MANTSKLPTTSFCHSFHIKKFYFTLSQSLSVLFFLDLTSASVAASNSDTYKEFMSSSATRSFLSSPDGVDNILLYTSRECFFNGNPVVVFHCAFWSFDALSKVIPMCQKKATRVRSTLNIKHFQTHAR